MASSLVAHSTVMSSAKQQCKVAFMSFSKQSTTEISLIPLKSLSSLSLYKSYKSKVLSSQRKYPYNTIELINKSVATVLRDNYI